MLLMWYVKDGDKVDVNIVLVSLEGFVCVILMVECMVFNFL